jgi:hypothetical protein
MKKSEYATYLRQRQLKKSTELSGALGIPKTLFETMVKKLPDDDIIDSYRICSHCGKEWLSRSEMDSLIQKYDNPERILNEIPSGHE